MWPLLIFSIFTLTLIIERAIALIYYNLSISDLQKKVVSTIEQGSIENAISLCQGYNKRKIGASVLLAGLRLYALGEHRMEKSIEQEAVEKVNKLERGLDFLVALGSLAPITGFLGTVSGMIKAFQNIAAADDVNAQMVAGGIFEALITTAFGLAISIAAIAAYNIFVHIVDRFAADIEQAGGDVVTAVLVKTTKE